MTEQHAPSSKISIEDPKQQLELWDRLAEWGRNNIGPKKDRTSDLESQLKGFLVPDKDSAKWERELPPGVEYQQDGAKTTIIVADKLLKEFKDWFSSTEKPDIAESLNICKILGEVTNTVLSHFSEGEDRIRPGDVVKNAPGLPLLPKNWPLDESLDERLHPDKPDWKHPRIPVADACFPFIVLDDHPQGDDRDPVNVYELDQGLGTAYFDNVPDSIWDEMLGLFPDEPYLIFCSGILRGDDWFKVFADDIEKIGESHVDKECKPYLIVLADGVAEDVEDVEDVKFPSEFYSVVLPAPLKTKRPDSGYVPKRPKLEKMASIFGTEVVHLWASPPNSNGEETGQEKTNRKLGRCERAHIGYTSSTLLIPAKERETKKVEFDIGCQGWQIRKKHIALLDKARGDSPGRVGAMMRWRIEAEEGLAAGAGAALYRAAGLLEERAAKGDSPDPAKWLQAALREPLHQILENAGIRSDEDRFNELIKWIDSKPDAMPPNPDSGDTSIVFPWDDPEPDAMRPDPDSGDTFFVPPHRRTFRLDPSREDSEPQPDDAAKLGVVTPLPQLRRSIEQAVPLAWQLALLYLTDKFQNGELKSKKEPKPRNPQAKKYKLYLSEKCKVPAAGLYYYTEVKNPARYYEHIIEIGKNGKLAPRFLRERRDIKIGPKKPYLHNIYIFSDDWLKIPAGGLFDSLGSPPAYLALLPPDSKNGSPLTIWTNALQPCCNSQDSYVLPPQLYRLLPRISRQRRQQGYLHALKAIKRQKIPPNLAKNAELFCVAGATVSCGLIERLQYTVNARSGYQRLSKYQNPDWIFQLNRVLSEGFIEGGRHIFKPKSGNYYIPQDSVDSWKIVLKRANKGGKSKKLKKYLKALSPDKQRQAMYVLAEAFAHKFPPWLQKPLKIPLLWFILQLLTPGGILSEELAFWNIHYPHWHKDLAYALKTFGYGPEPLAKDQNDWDTIAIIIMASMPITKDVKDIGQLIKRNRGLSANDWVVAWVWRWLGKRVNKLPDLTLLMVQYIFDDVMNEQHKQPNV